MSVSLLERTSTGDVSILVPAGIFSVVYTPLPLPFDLSMYKYGFIIALFQIIRRRKVKLNEEVIKIMLKKFRFAARKIFFLPFMNLYI